MRLEVQNLIEFGTTNDDSSILETLVRAMLDHSSVENSFFGVLDRVDLYHSRKYLSLLEHLEVGRF